jgi:hypothetical protein
VARAVEHFGHVDVLVANHAYGTRQPRSLPSSRSSTAVGRVGA